MMSKALNNTLLRNNTLLKYLKGYSTPKIWIYSTNLSPKQNRMLVEPGTKLVFLQFLRCEIMMFNHWSSEILPIKCGDIPWNSMGFNHKLAGDGSNIWSLAPRTSQMDCCCFLLWDCPYTCLAHFYYEMDIPLKLKNQWCLAPWKSPHPSQGDLNTKGDRSWSWTLNHWKYPLVN